MGSDAVYPDLDKLPKEMDICGCMYDIMCCQRSKTLVTICFSKISYRLEPSEHIYFECMGYEWTVRISTIDGRIPVEHIIEAHKKLLENTLSL